MKHNTADDTIGHSRAAHDTIGHSRAGGNPRCSLTSGVQMDSCLRGNDEWFFLERDVQEACNPGATLRLRAGCADQPVDSALQEFDRQRHTPPFGTECGTRPGIWDVRGMKHNTADDTIGHSRAGGNPRRPLTAGVQMDFRLCGNDGYGVCEH